MASNLALQRLSPQIYFLCFQQITCSVYELVIPKKDSDFFGNLTSASCRAMNKKYPSKPTCFMLDELHQILFEC